MRVINFLVGFNIGALLGAGAVLLLTPKSGSEVQESISGYFNHLAEVGSEAYQARMAELDNRMEDVKQGRG